MLKRLTSLAIVSLAFNAHAGPNESVTLDIKGMDCATCPITVKTVLKKQAGVTDVRVDFKKATAEITFRPDQVSREKLAQVVTEAGFPSVARK
jgi:mercuric ion binding protein